MSWGDLLGHDAVVRSFQHAWSKGRLAHAYLLTGPEGVGKHTFARKLARALLCSQPIQPLDSCGKCTSCTLFDAGTHADCATFYRPDDVNELPIEVIRELTEVLALKPMQGGRKIVILDHADELNDASANAFLKTLEEPPPGSILLLIGGPTSETQLATIVSRCQVIRFAPLTAAQMRNWLYSHGIEEATKQDRLIRLASGSPGQALALDDEELWQFRGSMISSFCDPQRDSVQQAKSWMKFIQDAGKEGSLQRRRAGLLIRLLLEFLQWSLRSSVQEHQLIYDPEQQRAQELAQRIGTVQLMKWIDRCLAAEMHLDRKVQLTLLVEGLLDSLREPKRESIPKSVPQ